VAAPAPEKVVVALPDTGVGIGDPSALFALITSAGAAAASLGLRRR
jgi:LPXTG-motif cell wall-anchored protein